MQNDFLTPYKEDSGVLPYLPFPRFLVPFSSLISAQKKWLPLRGITVYHTIPHYAEGEAESVLDKLRRIMAGNLEETEWKLLKKEERRVII